MIAEAGNLDTSLLTGLINGVGTVDLEKLMSDGQGGWALKNMRIRTYHDGLVVDENLELVAESLGGFEICRNGQGTCKDSTKMVTYV